jgi:hypothetical protein
MADFDEKKHFRETISEFAIPGGYKRQIRSKREDGKKASLNIRTTEDLKLRLGEAARLSGRTMSQEADVRLEISLARSEWERENAKHSS